VCRAGGLCWYPIRKRAGVRPLTFQATRHTAATFALVDHQLSNEVAAMIGQSDVGTVRGPCAHADVTRRSPPHAIGARIRFLQPANDRPTDTPLKDACQGQMRGPIGNPYAIRDSGADPLGGTGRTSRMWCRGRDSNPYKVALTSPSS
jgi:hypothetical protein